MFQSYRAQQRGFTLIELLIAMAISAVVVVMAYQALDEAIQVQSVSEAHTERWQAIEKTLLWLDKDVSQLTPRPVKDELGGDLPALLYREDLGTSFTRIAAQPTLFESGGLLRLDYLLENGRLIRRIWPVPDRAPDTEPVTQELLDQVNAIEWRFLDLDGQWHAVWPPANAPLEALPGKIEVTLSLKDQGDVRRLWNTPGNFGDNGP